MSAKPKPLSAFPLGKATDRDYEDHTFFLAWLRLNHKPRYTEATRFAAGMKPSPAYVFTAHNRAKIGFSTGKITELVYLHPESPSWFHIDIKTSGIRIWREGGLPDDEFRFARRWHYALAYRLVFWRINLPNLLDYLGCASDLRLITTLTVILNYKSARLLPPTDKGHLTAEQTTFFPEN